MFDDTVPMDPVLGSASLLDTASGREALSNIFGGYVGDARSFGTPSVVGTPTFRASERWISTASGHEVGELNQRAVAFHRQQAQPLATAGVDFLYAATFCSVAESIGVAQAMAETGSTTVVSFVLGPDARVLDGTPLDVAIRRVDDGSPPAWFALSCVHPDVAARAVDGLGAGLDRLREVKANASALSPDQLVTLDHVDTGDPEARADSMARLGRDAGIPVLGGCCGTDGRHLRALAGLLTS